MTAMKDGLVEVNGARIHYEVRGSGPPLLLIMGLTGDAGWFEPLAKILAERFTVITYDRRRPASPSAHPSSGTQVVDSFPGL